MIRITSSSVVLELFLMCDFGKLAEARCNLSSNSPGTQTTRIVADRSVNFYPNSRYFQSINY